MGEVVYILSGILLSHKKELNLAICDMDGPRGYCAECNESNRERQMPYDFTYMWSLKNKINKTNKFIDTENILMVDRWEGGWGMGKEVKGIKMYGLVITK